MNGDGWRELLVPLLDPEQRTWLALLASTVVVAFLFSLSRGLRGAARATWDGLLAPRLWTHRSAVLDVQLLLAKGLLRGMGLLPVAFGATTVALGVHRTLAPLGSLDLPVPAWAVTALYSAVLFVAWDLSRYVLHRLMHEVPVLWELHQVHHSAEVLTPLTHHRTHPLESVLYGLRGALVTGVVAGAFLWGFGATAAPAQLFGVSLLGLGLNALHGNLRHSHVHISYGPLERWLVSPAQHQLHHALGRDRTNFGAWLAVWDRLGGTLALSRPEHADLGHGLLPSERNHEPDDLLGALVAPVRGAVLALVGRPARWVLGVALLFLAPTLASAEDGAEGPTGEESSPESSGDADAAEGSDEPSSDPDAPDSSDPDAEGDDARSVNESVTIVDRRGRTPRVAGSAHVLDAEDLERFENDDIHRVLAPVPGVYVRDEDGFGLRPNIGLRGANSDRSAKITLEEDGVLLAPAPYSAPAAYYFPMTTRMVGVEVFKGPAATSHGPHTVGGAVNLKTRAVPRGRAAGGVDVAFGTYDTLKLHGHVGGGSRTLGALLEGVLLRTDGFKELDGGGSTGFLKGELMFKGRVATPDEGPVRSAWELKLGYSGERSNETYLGLSNADFAEDPYRRYAASRLGLMAWRRAQAELAWTLRAGRDVDARVVGYYHHLDRSWTKLNGFANGTSIHGLLLGEGGGQAAIPMAILRGEADSEGPDQQLLIGTNHRRYHAGGVQGRARWRASLGPVTNQLEVGLRVHHDRILRDHDEAPHAMQGGEPVAMGETVLTTQNDHSATALAVYATDELAVGPLRVLPGVRMEVVRTRALDLLADHSLAKTQAVGLPGLGLHLQATPWLSVLAGAHRGFSPSAPSTDPETTPETSWNVEGGARVDHRGLQAEVIGFYNHYENLTGQCTFSGGCGDDQVGTTFNAGKVHVYGLEALVRGEIALPGGFGVRGNVSYTVTGSRFATTFVSGFPQFGLVEAGDALPYVPEHQGAAGVGFSHPFGNVDLVAKAQSAMRDAAGQGAIPENEVIPAYVVLDLSADVWVSQYVRLYVTVSNLTNAKYLVSRRPFGARPGRPFHGMVGAKLRF